MRLVLGLGVVSVALLSSGCSLVFVKGTPARAAELPPSAPLECTSGKAAPIIDTLIAGYQVFRTGYAISATDSDYSGAPIKRDADIGLGVGLTALFLGSAIYGYSSTGTCSDAKERHQERQRELVPPGAPAGYPAHFTPGAPQLPPYAPPPDVQAAPEATPSPASAAPAEGDSPSPAGPVAPATAAPATAPSAAPPAPPSN